MPGKIDYKAPKNGNSLLPKEKKKKKREDNDDLLLGQSNNLQDMHVKKQDSELRVRCATMLYKADCTPGMWGRIPPLCTYLHKISA